MTKSMNSKFSCPPTYASILHRTALVQTLMNIASPAPSSAQHTKLILLRAPAGYGKTTLIADFVRHASLASCWYTLDHTDRDQGVFLEQLITSVRDRFPEFMHDFSPVTLLPVETAEQRRTQQMTKAVDAFLTAVQTEISQQFAIILCNYHEVTDHPGIDALVSYVLQHLPSHCFIIMESRTLPSLVLDPLLLVHSETFELGSDALRFTVQEVYDLSQLLRKPLSYHEAEQIVAHYEGWIAGILLGSHLSTRFVPPYIDWTSPTVRVEQRNLFKYVMKEVFKQESAILTFLKQTSILTQMTPTLCNTVLTISDSESCLAYVERQGLFVTRLTDEPEPTYRCHPILRELLQEELQQQQPEQFTVLHRRAAFFFQQGQNHDRAIYHAFEAGEYDLAAQTICTLSRLMLQQGYSESLTSWIDALPSTTLEHYPELFLARANIWLTLYQPDAALPLLDQAFACLRRSPERTSNGVQKLSAEILIARGTALWFHCEYAQAHEACTQALALLPAEEHMLRALAYQQLGVCTCLSGEYQTGITHLHQSLHLWGQTDNRHIALLHSQLANAYDVISNYALAEYHRTQAIRICDHAKHHWGQINNQVGLAVMRMHQGAYADAESLLQHALELASMHHLQRGKAYALVNLGVLYQEQGNYPQALTITGDGLALACQLKDQFLINQALLNQAMIYLLMGDPQTAHLLLSEVQIDLQTKNKPGYEASLHELTLGTIFLYQHRYDEASTILHSVEQNARRTVWKRGQIKALIRLASCNLAQGHRTATIWHMEQALNLNKGGEYEHLLQAELRRQPALEHIVQILQIPKELPPVGHPFRQTTLSLSNVPSRRCCTLAFGEPMVQLDGSPVIRWRMSRSMELYFFLLSSGRPVHKESIITQLWPNANEQIHQTFRSTVHYLRKAIGENCIISRFGTYALDLSALYGEDIWYDVAAFQDYYALAKDSLVSNVEDEAQQAFEQMVKLYRGDYLQPVYSDWCILPRDELRRAYMNALEELARIAWNKKQLDACLHYWQRLLYIDTCLEDAHYGIMCCYLRQGKRALALRQYHQCREILFQELSIVPGIPIQKLYQKHLQNSELDTHKKQA